MLLPEYVICDRPLKVQTFLPSEGGAVRRVVRVCDGKPQQDVTVRFVLLHVDSVVALGEYWRVIIGVLDVDVDQNTGGERL